MERSEAEKKAKKTLKGHTGRLRIAFYYKCECGWTGAQALGPGARSAASYDFYCHKVHCLTEQA
jgi:hypothetical protein